MNTQVDIEAHRARTLLIALRALLECASIVEHNNDQIAGAVFLVTELSDAIEKLATTLSVVSPANDAS